MATQTSARATMAAIAAVAALATAANAVAPGGCIPPIKPDGQVERITLAHHVPQQDDTLINHGPDLDECHATYVCKPKEKEKK